MMGLNIEELSKQENKLIKRAKQDYRKIYDNAHASVALLWEFIDTIDNKAWIFMAFLSQVRTSLTLALLSAIRKHEVQTYMLLRQALESACLAIYGLHKQNPDEFGVIKKDRTIEIDDKIKEKCYSFIKFTYPEYSKIIKDWKDMINNRFAHPNIVTSHSTFEYLDEKMGNSFFDKNDKFITGSSLWQIANITLAILALCSDAADKVPLVKFCNDFKSKAKILLQENDNMREMMKKHPRVAKWNKSNT